ncbi:3-deoxy-7-phosphoheptulonate synthase [Desulfolucanica intricata]|uniref:3-deoxy-7-phosphoheptulonate synthase n=1 Tax=Desulfolucanica intricata TaxID=1285191 RepID=UPI00082D9C59|nr:3-deoxy-7-phosphoheptulonate synthase [Desulfolucanica intricata]
MPPFMLVSREHKKEDSVITIGSYSIGGGQVLLIAGPCAVESEEQVMNLAGALKKIGVHVMRGGAYKPRTSPYAFHGLKEVGLKILAKAGRTYDLPVITEVVDVRDLEIVSEYSDILQVGSRNMQNFTLLSEVGRSQKPVLLKRGFAATIEEWLLAAEYIMTAGNEKVILCERGIRTFETFTRNTLDISAVPAVKQLSHLPIMVDPSHACGRREMVPSLAKAAVAAGADGLMIEVHPKPEEALCDGFQSLNINEMENLKKELDKLLIVRSNTFSML